MRLYSQMFYVASNSVLGHGICAGLNWQNANINTPYKDISNQEASNKEAVMPL